MTDLPLAAAGEQLAALSGRRISARELLEAHLARHQQVHGTVNAVVATDVERARAEATETDAARVRGVPLGPLAGLPMTVKDCFDVAGLPAVCGAPALVDRPTGCRDADVVAAVRAAGAVVWGKSNVPFMLDDFQTYNRVYGTTRNPYDPARTPGGSSGGAAAALAAGVTPLEIGSDIGGSLRHPANFCGVYALKPTDKTLSLRGQVPPGPEQVPLSDDLGVAGPMARTVADLQLLWDVLRGTPSRPAVDRPAGTGMRVALWLDEPTFVLDDEVRAAVSEAAKALQQEGVTVEPARLPFSVDRMLDTYWASLFPILMAGLPDRPYAALRGRRAEAKQAVAAGADRYTFEATLLHGTADYRAVELARAARHKLRDELARWFRDWDAILTPVSPVPAFTHRQDGVIASRTLEVNSQPVPYLRMLDWTALATGTRLPALVAPVDATGQGLPVGAQLIGGPGTEDVLFALAATLERITGGFRPPSPLPDSTIPTHA